MIKTYEELLIALSYITKPAANESYDTDVWCAEYNKLHKYLLARLKETDENL